MEALGFEFRQEAVLHTLSEDVLKSTEIEGEKLDAAQVAPPSPAAWASTLARSNPRPRRRSVVEMMLTPRVIMTNRSPPKGCLAARGPVSHRRSGLTRIAAGAWRNDRNGPMQVVSGPIGKERSISKRRGGPPASRNAAFLDWFNKPAALDPVLKAAQAHLWFVTIHPFDDGNGRLAGPSPICPGTLRKQPAALLQHVGPDPAGARRLLRCPGTDAERRHGHHPWMEWFLGCLGRAIDGAQTTLAAISPRRASGNRLRASPSTSANAWSSTACWMALREAHHIEICEARQMFQDTACATSWRSPNTAFSSAVPNGGAAPAMRWRMFHPPRIPASCPPAETPPVPGPDPRACASR